MSKPVRRMGEARSPVRQRACEVGVAAALRRQPRQQWSASRYTGELQAHLVVTGCSAPLAGHTHWTLQLLAERPVALQVLPQASPALVRWVLKKCAPALGVADVSDSFGPK